MDFIIRQATEADVEALARLLDAFLNETLAPPAHVERNPELKAELAVARLLRKERAVMLVAEAAGVPAGFAYAEIRRATGKPEGLRARVSDFLTRRRAFLPVLRPERGWLGHLYVAPEHRRRGLACALVRAAGDWARSRGASALELNVLASNVPARRLYEKLGLTATLIDYRLPL